jgi:hypothetical protein
MFDVFLSYHQKDEHIALLFYQLFKSCNFNPFFAKVSIPPGADISTCIKQSIKKSNSLVVLWSKTSVEAEWVIAEARYAWKQKKIIPVFIESFETDLLPFELQFLRAVDLSDWKGDPDDEHFKLILNKVAQNSNKSISYGKELDEKIEKIGVTITGYKKNASDVIMDRIQIFDSVNYSEEKINRDKEKQNKIVNSTTNQTDILTFSDQTRHFNEECAVIGNEVNKNEPIFIKKTLIVGESLQQANPKLLPDKRVDDTSSQSVNPYTQIGSSSTRIRNNGFDGLPDGNSPIPLGSGVIVGFLGLGGMANVYKIWNEKLEVFRAVKILQPTQQADLYNRFFTEVKITSKLHHPNIVETYNIGEWHGLPYLEMEYVDGISLESLISNNGNLPDQVCSAIAILIANALEYAHSQEFLIYGKNYKGVIHRDLKPANIMIPKNGNVRLMDFGIARPTQTGLHTVNGNIVGTLPYLSPEQIDGVDIDARTDIYSFGSVLYEMITGTRTFPQDSVTDLMKKKIRNEYRKFSDFNFPISKSLARISQKCLQINKTDRYSNTGLLVTELECVHKSKTSEEPRQIIKRFIDNPDTFLLKSKKRFGSNFFYNIRRPFIKN